MSITKTGALPNAYKYFIVAINEVERKQPSGLVSHVSRTGTAAFHSATQLAHIFNDVFEQIHYPMSTMVPRLFGGKIPKRKTSAEPTVEFSGPDEGDSLKGRLATFRIHVQYRHHATWQGNITWLERGTTYVFDSFLQLMKIFDRILGNESPRTAPRRTFANEFELMEEMEALFAPTGHFSRETVIVPRRRLTFVIRILFDCNATWQGIVCWKETGEQESFRSFLELLMMMDEVAGRVSGREGKAGGAEENAS